MLDELRDLFLAALKFEGNNAMPLINRWNEAVKRVQAVFDSMADKTVDAVPVVRCKDCKWYRTDGGYCGWRDMGDDLSENFYCADGERKGGDK